MTVRHRKSAGLFIRRFSYASASFRIFRSAVMRTAMVCAAARCLTQLVDGVRQFPHIVAQLFRFRFRLIRTLVGLVTNTVDNP